MDSIDFYSVANSGLLLTVQLVNIQCLQTVCFNIYSVVLVPTVVVTRNQLVQLIVCSPYGHTRAHTSKVLA